MCRTSQEMPRVYSIIMCGSPVIRNSTVVITYVEKYINAIDLSVCFGYELQPHAYQQIPINENWRENLISNHVQTEI